ncbi:UvrD-like helicase ATP-binding domain-containing protein [Mycena indigotica]|uniref:UvrD-like helicase ATP-binding domain-containing protein n=1 Tax=Mycena indigotica TaxID=2126181 RepID=A0A8H6SVN4_9AGAR|nr:UvrD-like helicase ATP-binding domain-containing protein [Mycena indigotica]KAF7306321.1 UvrD-like helicase ATP-binding domain-containing protein [Mycena indigotica]
MLGKAAARVPLSSRGYIDLMDAGLSGVSGAQHIISMISSRRSVTKLILGSNNLGDDGCIVLFKFLASAVGRKHQIAEISLNTNRLGNRGLLAIAEYLQDNQSLRQLLLPYNTFTYDAEVLTRFTSALNSSRLQLLSLTGNHDLSDPFVCEFLPLLDSPELQELHLSATGLTPNASPSLIEYVSSPRCHLHVLKCNGNSLGFRAIKAIVRAVERHNFTIVTLEMYSNQATTEPVNSDNTEDDEEDQDDGAGPSSVGLDAWKANDASIRRVLLRNSHLKRVTEKDALCLLRYSRPLLLPRQMPDAVPPTEPSPSGFAFRSLPTELQLYIMSFFAPSLSPAQRIRIYTYASSSATLPRITLSLPGFPIKGTSMCVLDPAIMPSTGSSSGCAGGRCAGAGGKTLTEFWWPQAPHFFSFVEQFPKLSWRLTEYGIWIHSRNEVVLYTSFHGCSLTSSGLQQRARCEYKNSFRKLSYRAELFVVATPEDVENAAMEFATMVTVSNVDRILQDVLEHESPTIARLAIASLGKDLVLSHFPTKPQDFNGSLVARVLSDLSVFFLLAHKITNINDNHHILVKEALIVLQTIAQQIMNLKTKSSHATTSKHGKVVMSLNGLNHKSRVRHQRTPRNAGPEVLLDIAPFERLGIGLPKSLEEFEQAEALIISTQKSILEAYLESLRLPHVWESLKSACLQTEMPESEPEIDAEVNDREDGPAVDIHVDNDTPFHVIQTIKFSAIYRKRIAGFGDWDINLAPQAEQQFRTLNKQDKALFNVLWKTLRMLSRGRLADATQQINTVESELPIFKVAVGEEFLVYYVDCVATDDQNDQQVLKVFGLYPASEVSGGTFWDSMSRELSKRGTVYIARCNHRQPDLTQSGVFTPMVFTARITAVDWDGPTQLPTDDTERILSLLLKTIHFSQDVMRSIIEDIEATFVLVISPEERRIVEHDESCYVFGRSGTGKTTTMLYKMLLIETSCLQLSARPVRQLFVTQSRTLADKVGEHFRHLISGYRPTAVARNLIASKIAGRALVKREERDKLRDDLPSRYSELQDHHFPLFISFEQLCVLLENDVVAQSEGTSKKTPTYLTFDKFKTQYWLHFPQALTRGLDAASIFSEFMGVIMGSEAALASTSSYLGREAYVASQPRRNIPASLKTRIYDLFLKYHSEKRCRGDLDLADRTRLVLQEFRKNGVPGQKIDYLYVDEVQDNLLIDMLLLRSLCHNPNGLFWAGDTAQTISAGSAFRFKELKAFLYRVEQRRKCKQPGASFMPVSQPQIFQLTTNYRSHTGIVNCARTIIETIMHFWPDSIDKLQPERATVDGLTPLFFDNRDNTVDANRFLFGPETSGGRIDFGAYQCILVRDKSAKERFLREVGELAIIMPIYDAKGLEFNDILLYDFFADSDVEEAQWRVILNMLEEEIAPAFDSIRHSSVCMELKSLYVAVTRARSNLWIVDRSSKGEPMRALWARRHQVQNCSFGKDTRQFAIASRPEDWKAQGEELFDKGLFSNARLCFQRAFMPHEAAISNAYALREEAEEMFAKPRETKLKFVEAGNAFLSCAKSTTDTETSWEYAAIAGDCFERGDSLLCGVEAFTLARKFDKVATFYRKLGMFDEMVQTIQQHPEIDTTTSKALINVARLFYFKSGHPKKAAALFSSTEDPLEYLSSRGLQVERARFLQDVKEELSQAAEVQLQAGKLFAAIELFVRDGNSERAAACIAQGFWASLPFATTAVASDPSVSRLLKFAARLDLTCLASTRRDEINMFEAIINQDIDKLRIVGQSFQTANNTPAVLLCLDHYFTHRSSVQDLEVDALVDHLSLFLLFVKHLYHAAFGIDPATTSGAARLMGFSKDSEDRFTIPPTWFLQQFLNDSKRPQDVGSCVVSAFQLRNAYQTALRRRLYDHVWKENASCRTNKVFRGPCLTFTLFNRHCNRHECQQEHVDPATLTPESYTLRVRAHLLQILIYQSLQFQRMSIAERGFWMSRLYSILNPSSYRLGSPGHFRLRNIPEAALGLRVLGDWLRDGAYGLGFEPGFPFFKLTHFVEIVQLAFQFDRQYAMDYLTKAPFMNTNKPLIYQRGPGGYVLFEFLKAIQDAEEWSLSAGVIFLRHIAVENALPIQIRLICDLADNICGRLIIADRQRRGGVFHNITLPLSWLVRQVTSGRNGFVSPRASNTCWIFARTLVALLEPVLTGVGAGHLLFDNKDLANAVIGFRIRNIFLARLCRCLGLLVYNFGSASLRMFVFQSITSLGSYPPRIFSQMTMSFIQANDWPEMARAVRGSTGDSALDEMVQLLHVSNHRPPAMPNVRQIVHRHLDELPQLLGLAPAPSAGPSPSVLKQTTQIAPETMTNQQVVVAATKDADQPGDDDEGLVEENVTLPTYVEPASRPQKEIAAAEKLHRVLTQALERGKQRQTDGSIKSQRVLPAIVESFLVYRQLVRITPESTLTERVYARTVWGPLQHLLHCLRLVHHVAQEKAQQFQQDFKNLDHEALEALDEKLTAVQCTLETTTKFQKVLGSTDKEGIHRDRNLAGLKQRVKEAIVIFSALPFAWPPHGKAHFGVVVHWMENWPESELRKPTAKRVKRPRLNMGDEADIDDF